MNIRSGETYIGDGVYVSHDGYQFWLRTERDDGQHRIALEPGVLASFLAYTQRIYKTHEEDINE